MNTQITGDLHFYYNVETQKNIVFNDLGALWYLKSSGGKTRLNIDSDPLMLGAYNSATEPAVNAHPLLSSISSGLQLGDIYSWKARLAPDSAYNFLVKEIGK